jgi:hypothetical protein
LDRRDATKEIAPELRSGIGAWRIMINSANPQWTSSEPIGKVKLQTFRQLGTKEESGFGESIPPIDNMRFVNPRLVLIDNFHGTLPMQVRWRKEGSLGIFPLIPRFT